MAISKIIYGGDTLIDLTHDTVTAENIDEGITAHSASGEELVGLRKVFDVLPIANGGTGATTVRGAANNFYETGTWTPKLICTGTNAVNPTYTLSNVVGYYCRIGKLVHIYCSMDTNITAIGSGYAAVGGLPFAFYDGSALDLIQAYSCITTSSNDIHPIVHLGVSGSTYYAIFRAPSGAGAYKWKVHSGGNIKFSGVYRCGG